MKNIPYFIYLGPEGTYTEVAAEKFIEKLGISDFNRKLKNSILGVISAMEDPADNIGVVPVENSIEGVVRETIDSLVRTSSRVLITGEVIIPVSHCLISRAGRIDKIDRIISMPQALAQCRNFLEEKFPAAEKLPAKSTSEAVKQLAQLPDNYAAIGSSRAGEIYGHNILFSEINDEKDNFTRFISIGSSSPQPTGRDKTSIAIKTNNTPGSLAEVLIIFKEYDINLCYIESRPSRKVFGDYTFFIDFEGHIKDKNVRKTIEKITPLVNFYRFLGSYPRENFKKYNS